MVYLYESNKLREQALSEVKRVAWIPDWDKHA